MAPHTRPMLLYTSVTRLLRLLSGSAPPFNTDPALARARTMVAAAAMWTRVFVPVESSLFSVPTRSLVPNDEYEFGYTLVGTDALFAAFMCTASSCGERRTLAGIRLGLEPGRIWISCCKTLQ